VHGLEVRPHARFLWALLYRMTGVAADADELLQEAYLRVLQHPPQGELRPYLTRVAVHLARDRLRRRRREATGAVWLPGALPTPGEQGASGEPGEPGEEALPAMEATLPDGRGTEARYSLLESVSWAFLLALEALTPAQRAVLLLRDVFEQPVEEVARGLGLSAANVRVIHHRARARLEAYEAGRPPSLREVGARARAALEAFLAALAQGDVEAAGRLLAADVTSLQDGGPHLQAARVPVVGRERVLLFHRRLMELRGMPTSFAWRALNGRPTLVVRWEGPVRSDGWPREAAQQVELDAEGRIRVLLGLVDPRKLAPPATPGVLG
jgi:RNA polymerase sigma-70 factor (ECF subfamily)